VASNSLINRLSRLEKLNFLLTNRIPRRWATLFMGWFSRIENPVVTRLSMALWAMFADDLNLQEARSERFRSLHDCFIRELKPGARPIDRDPAVTVSPCDAVVGAFGNINGTELIQAKGFPYTLDDLTGSAELSDRYQNGRFITLRLKSSMYHRFHAPCDCRVSSVDYISGDTWNVNPVALKRIERLFCKNERIVVDLELQDHTRHLTLVPVAAILVASIKLHFLPEPLDLRYSGPNRIPCDASFTKGQELGYFQHGSTIIVLADRGFRLHPRIRQGSVIRTGEPLLLRSPFSEPIG
jgi:phosphatidylserine decarboxylase